MKRARYFAGKPMMPSAGDDHRAEAIGTRWSSMNIAEYRFSCR